GPDRVRRVGRGEWPGGWRAGGAHRPPAVRWSLAHAGGPLPPLLRVLWLFWDPQDQVGEVRAWVGQLLPTADTLGPQARAELLWTAAVTAVEVGDDLAALSARQRLEPLVDGIEDPFLRASCQLALAWTSTIAGDVGGALRETAA